MSLVENNYVYHSKTSFLKTILSFSFPDFFTDDRGTKPLPPTGIAMEEIHNIGSAYSTPPGIEFTIHQGNMNPKVNTAYLTMGFCLRYEV